MKTDALGPRQTATITSLILALALGACTTSGLKAGQGGIDQNVRGGVFTNYRGDSEVVETTVDVDAVDERGNPVRVRVKSNAPFVIALGDLEANTDAGTAGQTNDQIDAKTDGAKTDATGTLTK